MRTTADAIVRALAEMGEPAAASDRIAFEIAKTLAARLLSLVDRFEARSLMEERLLSQLRELADGMHPTARSGDEVREELRRLLDRHTGERT